VFLDGANRVATDRGDGVGQLIRELNAEHAARSAQAARGVAPAVAGAVARGRRGPLGGARPPGGQGATRARRRGQRARGRGRGMPPA